MTGSKINTTSTDKTILFNLHMYDLDNPHTWAWQMLEYLGFNMLDHTELTTDEIEFYLHEIFG